MIREELSNVIKSAVLSAYDVTIKDVEVTLAQPGFGDFSSNVAFGLANTLKLSPREISSELAKVMRHPKIQSVVSAGAGFINILLTDVEVMSRAKNGLMSKPHYYDNQVVITEYSDPNPFKVLHVGHFYTTVIGDAVSNLIRLAGGDVHAVNFGGDVGLHVGRTLWAMLQHLGGENPPKLSEIQESNRSEWMATCYVEGTEAYEINEIAKAEIIKLNAAVYEMHEKNDHESPLAQIYWTCRGWSYDYFDKFYAQIGSSFERYYPESETAPLGLQTVREQIPTGVYTESDGAVVFIGEPYGLHTRVFITSQGLPSYETKDVGVLMAKWRDYTFDRSIVITGNDITEYMKVVLKSVEQYAPELAKRSTHITHGNVKLVGSVKMSSRKGNFLRAQDVLTLVTDANKTANGNTDESVVLGAIKYSFLKQRIGSDLVFIPEESVVLDGNSGPYLQYAHARARSILNKVSLNDVITTSYLEKDERALAVKLSEYRDVLDRSISELLPHYLCTYLYELAQTFNRFYEHNRVVGDEREQLRIELVMIYADILKNGLTVLGISAPDKL